ncbi:MAG TPA: hypothetical protein VK927_06585 [Adhaeribacter sp.]|nr:hypothetical protein [Adhaeribacter sp.]
MKKQEPFRPDASKYHLLFQADYISIYNNTLEGWLYAQWKGTRTQENAMQGVEQILHYLNDTGSRKIIIDSRLSKNSLLDVVDWVSKVVAPKLEATGLEHLAWIYSDNNHARPLADAILAKDKTNIIVLVSDKIETAETWLRTLK